MDRNAVQNMLIQEHILLKKDIPINLPDFSVGFRANVMVRLRGLHLSNSIWLHFIRALVYFDETPSDILTIG